MWAQPAVPEEMLPLTLSPKRGQSCWFPPGGGTSRTALQFSGSRALLGACPALGGTWVCDGFAPAVPIPAASALEGSVSFS